MSKPATYNPAVFDVRTGARALKPDGKPFVLNSLVRAAPTVEHGWQSDCIDMKALLAQEFQLVEEGQLPLGVTSEVISRFSFWASYRRRPGS